MRFIGNKENIVSIIFDILKSNNVLGNSFFDLFAGTSSVGKFFKSLNYKIISSDLLYFSYVLQKAYIENNSVLHYNKLLKYILPSQSCSDPLITVLNYLNNLKPSEGFIYFNYTPSGSSSLEIPRQYFSDMNGKIIDSIRSQIETWFNNELISIIEYYFLLACLIESVPYYANISGVYAAFNKKWDARALKQFTIRPINTISNCYDNFVFNVDSLSLINTYYADIYYLDPPYNFRQYAPNYHILETIAKYDNPPLKGVTGLRPYNDQKSLFCNKNSAITQLDYVAKFGQFKHLVLSYNSEGLLSIDTILSIFNKYGKTKFHSFDYNRFKSNNSGDAKHKKIIQEYIFILNKQN